MIFLFGQSSAFPLSFHTFIGFVKVQNEEQEQMPSEDAKHLPLINASPCDLFKPLQGFQGDDLFR